MTSLVIALTSSSNSPYCLSSSSIRRWCESYYVCFGFGTFSSRLRLRRYFRGSCAFAGSRNFISAAVAWMPRFTGVVIDLSADGTSGFGTVNIKLAGVVTLAAGVVANTFDGDQIKRGGELSGTSVPFSVSVQSLRSLFIRLMADTFWFNIESGSSTNVGLSRDWISRFSSLKSISVIVLCEKVSRRSSDW